MSDSKTGNFESGQQPGTDTLGQACREIWEDAEKAMKSLAVRRGLPHDSLADLKQAVRNAAMECPDRRLGIIAGLQSALSFRDNIDNQYMDESDLEYFTPGVREFVDELNGLSHPTEDPGGLRLRST